MKPFLLKKGAEASLYIIDWYGRKAIMKKRLTKKYRSQVLDNQIRKYRTIHEPKLIHEAKSAGVATPNLFFVNLKKATIIMEFINGKQVKEILNCISQTERKQLCYRIGEMIGKLHRFGIIHGDLTTSNIIVSSNGEIVFIDFGLGEKSKEAEARGVDLHLMKRALQSTHFKIAEECFHFTMEGYSRVLKPSDVKQVLDKIKEIERRGRYIAERKTRARHKQPNS
jgi:Kae1-associated kinase Bud32